MEKEIAILKVRDKEFVNDKGEKVPYKEVFVSLDGEEFPLYPTKNKKELFKYCLKKEIENLGD